MNNWGVFEIHDHHGQVAEIHVAPCTDEGRVAPGHILDLTCPCPLSIEHVGPGCPGIVIHETEQ